MKERGAERKESERETILSVLSERKKTWVRGKKKKEWESIYMSAYEVEKEEKP